MNKNNLIANLAKEKGGKMAEYKIVGNSLILTVPSKYHEMYCAEYIEALKKLNYPIIGSDWEEIHLTIGKIDFNNQKLSIMFYIFDSPTQISSIEITGAKSLEECFKAAVKYAKKEFSYYKENK